MKRLGLFALIIFSLLLASCSPLAQDCEKPFILKDGECCLDLDEDGLCDAGKTEEKEEPEVVVEETKEKVIEKKETKEDSVPAITGAVVGVDEPDEEDIKEFKESASIDASSLLEQLMKTYTESVESYKYNYHKNWYYVRGSKIKIHLAESIQFTGKTVDNKHYSVFYVDTVYLDTIEKTAVGYCEGNDPRLGKRRCLKLDLTDVPYPLISEDFYTKRPDEWLFEVYTLDPEVKTETGYYYLGPRKVKRIEYTDEPKKTIMYYDEAIGLPVKISTYINEQFSRMWLYDFLSINTVKDKHVVYRTAEEVSPKEAFYSTSN